MELQCIISETFTVHWWGSLFSMSPSVHDHFTGCQLTGVYRVHSTRSEDYSKMMKLQLISRHSFTRNIPGTLGLDIPPLLTRTCQMLGKEEVQHTSARWQRTDVHCELFSAPVSFSSQLGLVAHIEDGWKSLFGWTWQYSTLRRKSLNMTSTFSIHFHKKIMFEPKKNIQALWFLSLCSPHPVLWPMPFLLNLHPQGPITCLLLMLVKNSVSLPPIAINL